VTLGEASQTQARAQHHLQLQRQRDFIVRDIRMRPNTASLFISHWKSVAAFTCVSLYKIAQ